MKKMLAVLAALVALLTAPEVHAVDVYPAQGAGLIGRADGGYLPVAAVSCGDNLLCTFDRSTQMLTIRVNGWQGSLSYDFPALSSYPGGPSCALSSAVSIPGVELADFCMASSNFGMDGGTTLSRDVTLNGVIDAANTAKVQACVHLSDAGSIDLADAGYYLMCFSRRP